MNPCACVPGFLTDPGCPQHGVRAGSTVTGGLFTRAGLVGGQITHSSANNNNLRLTPGPYSGLDPELVPNDHMVGLRSFRVDSLGRLCPVNATEQPWRPGENICKCQRGGHPRTATKGEAFGVDTGQTREYTDHFDPDCACGFYAFHNGDNTFNGPGQVTAVIKGYGRTVIGDKGFRSEKAEILGLVAPTSQSQRVDTTLTFEPSAARNAWRQRWGAGLAAAVLLACAAVAATANGSLGVGIATACAAIAIGLRLLVAWRSYLDPRCLGDGAAGARGGFRSDGQRFCISHANAYDSVDELFRCACSYPEWRDGSWNGKSRAPSALEPHTLPTGVAELVTRNYPDVLTYPTVAAMTKAHPLTPPLEPRVPTPDDPDFWTAPAKGL